jgi:copper chaperone NosL
MTLQADKSISMKKKLSVLTKILLVTGAAGLIAVLFAPVWHIDLMAPQYPEGLTLQIYANGIRGNVDIINGLNHYIGMKTLHSEDFIEFAILPYIVVFFAVLFLVVVFINRRSWLNILFVSFLLFGIVAMVDFWKWEYNYGHNLTPDAAIKVPGMAYQPPLIGFKQLLNFGAWSFPDTGGWIFIGTGVLLLAAIVKEWKFSAARWPLRLFSVFGLLFCFVSCNTSPEPVQTGKDNCYLCKMTVTDNRFGAEIVTKKGKIYKFDDVHCIVSFIKTNTVPSSAIAGIYLVNYTGNHELINANDALLYQSDELRSPMNGNIAAFANEEQRKTTAASMKGENINWEPLLK